MASNLMPVYYGNIICGILWFYLHSLEVWNKIGFIHGSLSAGQAASAAPAVMFITPIER